MNVGVVGAGSFGTAISQIIALNVEEVILYSRRKKIAEDINKNSVNNEYYPNYKLNNKIRAVNSLKDLKECEVIFITVPSSGFRKTLEEMKNEGINDSILVTASKGIEPISSATMGQIIQEYYNDKYVVVSGPNFASEVVLNLPTVTNIASNSKNNLNIVKKILETEFFKVEEIDDVIGLEYCGILKNINAVANGICEGIQINENGRYAILTKGFNENKKIVESIGGKPSTIDEYCGFGDIILTSISKQSRNHTLGVLIGQKLEINKGHGVVFEGKNSVKTIKEICDKKCLDCKIVNFVYDVLVNKEVAKTAFKNLWKNITMK
ncbi:NAD(P)H-dependent glycerol-3-phosphate dehydrogenase [Methanobrevibacter curvatus]|nr:NAD(P)H-dependent glycerol-3-phosphate dehydrogenase [Methanobrevibacter curvatus]